MKKFIVILMAAISFCANAEWRGDTEIDAFDGTRVGMVMAANDDYSYMVGLKNFGDGDGDYFMVVGDSLPAGEVWVLLRVDAGEVKKFKALVSTNKLIIEEAPAGLVAELKAGSILRVRVVSEAENRKVDSQYNLSGFTRMYNQHIKG